MRLMEMIENPQEGEPVQFLGVYALRWRPEWGVEPTVAFRDAEGIVLTPSEAAELSGLLRKLLWTTNDGELSSVVDKWLDKLYQEEIVEEVVPQNPIPHAEPRSSQIYRAY